MIQHLNFRDYFLNTECQITRLVIRKMLVKMGKMKIENYESRAKESCKGKNKKWAWSYFTNNQPSTCNTLFSERFTPKILKG